MREREFRTECYQCAGDGFVDDMRSVDYDTEATCPVCDGQGVLMRVRYNVLEDLMANIAHDASVEKLDKLAKRWHHRYENPGFFLGKRPNLQSVDRMVDVCGLIANYFAVASLAKQNRLKGTVDVALMHETRLESLELELSGVIRDRF